MNTITIEVGYQNTKDRSEAARETRWTEQATGHTYWTYEIPTPARVMAIEDLAEAVYTADNCPFQEIPDGVVGDIVRAMVQRYEQSPERHHSLSVGDRVRFGEVEVVVASCGFERVQPEVTV